MRISGPTFSIFNIENVSGKVILPIVFNRVFSRKGIFASSSPPSTMLSLISFNGVLSHWRHSKKHMVWVEAESQPQKMIAKHLLAPSTVMVTLLLCQGRSLCGSERGAPASSYGDLLAAGENASWCTASSGMGVLKAFLKANRHACLVEEWHQNPAHYECKMCIKSFLL